MSPVVKGGVKPTGRVFTGRSTLGDGDPCPLDIEHGKMYAVAKNRQWCPHSDHSRGDLTRCFWPLYGLAEAVRAYTEGHKPAAVELPDIDLGELSL